MAAGNQPGVLATFSPRLIGGFSLDLSGGELEFHQDARHLGEIRNDLDGPVEWDLNTSMDKVKRRNQELHSGMKLESILKWIMQNPSCPRADFVSPLGVLAKVMRSEHKPEKPWTILATKLGKTIYLKKEMNEEARAIGTNEDRSSLWGGKFEQFMTKGSDPQEGCDENKAHYCVVTSTLASHSLLYRVEVDVVDYSYSPATEGGGVVSTSIPPTELEAVGSSSRLKHGLAHFVELKTIKNYPRGLPRFSKINWWSKAFLGGIPRVVCGIKDPCGIVTSLKEYKVQSMLSLSDSNTLKNFLNSFLDYVKENVVEDDPRVVYQVTVNRGELSCRRLNDTTKRLLTKEYVDFVAVQEN